MTITISHNEIIVACLKAFEALGLAQGQREDVANAVGWLALHGLPFEDCLRIAINQFDPKLSVPIKVFESDERSVWDAQGASAVHIFPSLVDYLCARSNGKPDYQLTILNMPDLELMWPYLAKAAERGHLCSLQWMPLEDVGRWVRFNEFPFPSIYWLTYPKQSVVGGEVQLALINMRKFLDAADIEGEILRVENGQSLASNNQEHTRNGIPISKSFWTELVGIGKGILVESTEESEKRGAGGV